MGELVLKGNFAAANNLFGSRARQDGRRRRQCPKRGKTVLTENIAAANKLSGYGAREDA
jgi:hypothetical protein